MQSLFSGIYKDKTVLVTGHTGFKGSWLSRMGAKVVGYSLEAPNHIELLNLDIISIIGDLEKLLTRYCFSSCGSTTRKAFL